ncbi:MAG TPA: hypothetical protein VF665_06010 [Longimicrobium sp.]|jgi:hypothetical protein|uniref:hypothetical protein n=1 Tax=Longimicrobium sp. TaxID=2029185 RepID=UPI002EDB2264
MLTWSLQFAGALLFLSVGLVSMGVALRARSASATHVAAWRVTGTVFTLHGLTFSVQNLWGLAAIRAGAESGTMRMYLLAAPVFNHGRTFLLLACCGLLFGLALRPRFVLPRLPALMGATLAFGFASGCLVGFTEGRLVAAVHYAAVARLDAVELVLLFGMLFIALLNDAMDRLNWGVLAVYAFSVALNVMWFAGLASINDPSVWSPKPSHILMIRALLVSSMLAMAAWRYRMVLAGTRVDGLMGASRRPVASHTGAGWFG